MMSPTGYTFDIDDELKNAVCYHKAGQLALAEQLYCRILTITPDNADALHLRGVIAFQNGQYDVAADLIHQAIQIDPNQSSFFTNLGNVYKEWGQPTEAIDAYLRAWALNPECAAAYYDLGNVLQAIGRFKEAASCYRQALNIDPKMTVAHNNLGVALNELGCEEKAIECYRTAVEQRPDFIDAYNNLAALLEGQNRIAEARHAVDCALAIDPHSFFAKLNQAQLEIRQEQYAPALKLLSELVKESPPIEFASKTYTALGVVYDKLGKYQEAFETFKKANTIEAASNRARCLESDRKKDLNWLDRVRVWNESVRCKDCDSNAFCGDLPRLIFLIGFPRSGTTLLEQIIRTNSKVAVLEEKPLLENIIQSIVPGSENDDRLLKISDSVAAEAGRRYLKLAGGLVGETLHEKVILDKLPLNIIYLGFIQRIFPQAKVIVALRHPLDTVLSNFMQRYKLNKRMVNFLVLERAAQFYSAVMSLYLRYHRSHGLNLIQIRYEKLVEDFEFETRRLFEYLDFDWDENALRFNEIAKSRNIHTPSYSQVVKPIYKDAVCRWKKYKKHLTPILPILRSFIEALDYSL